MAGALAGTASLGSVPQLHSRLEQIKAETKKLRDARPSVLPKPRTLMDVSDLRNPDLCTRTPETEPRNLKPETRNSKPETMIPKRPNL